MRVLSVVGNRPAVHQVGAALGGAARGGDRRGRAPHGAALRPRAVGGLLRASSGSAEPRYRLDLRSADPEAMRPAIARRGRAPSGPTGCSSSATRTRRSPAREAAGDVADRARRGGAAELRPLDAGGAQPDRGRPAVGAAPLPRRALGARSSSARASPGARRGRRRRDGRRHRGSSRRSRASAPTCSSGSGSSPAATRSSTVHREANVAGRPARADRRGARAALEEPLVFPAHPRTRAALDAARAATGSSDRCRSATSTSPRSPRRRA